MFLSFFHATFYFDCMFRTNHVDPDTVVSMSSSSWSSSLIEFPSHIELNFISCHTLWQLFRPLFYWWLGLTNILVVYILFVFIVESLLHLKRLKPLPSLHFFPINNRMYFSVIARVEGQTNGMIEWL